MAEHTFSFESIVAHSNDIVIVTKADVMAEPGPEIVYVNEAFSDLTGYSRDEAVGRSPRFLQGAETDPECVRLIGEALTEKRPVRTTIKNYTKHGDGYWLDINIMPLTDSGGGITHFMAIERDVTEEIERGRTLSALAGTDDLTGACDRHGFLDRAAHEVSRAKRYGDSLALAILDLDHFTAINETYGRSAANAVLQAFSAACHSILRETDIFARVGAEEFAVLMPSTPADAARGTMERLRRDLGATPIHWDGRSIQTSVSIGLATFLPFDESIEPILQRASAALFQAKTDGHNPVASAPIPTVTPIKPATASS